MKPQQIAELIESHQRMADKLFSTIEVPALAIAQSITLPEIVNAAQAHQSRAEALQRSIARTEESLRLMASSIQSAIESSLEATRSIELQVDSIQLALDSLRPQLIVQPPPIYFDTLLTSLRNLESQRDANEAPINVSEAIVASHMEASARAGLHPITVISLILTILTILMSTQGNRERTNEHDVIEEEIAALRTEFEAGMTRFQEIFEAQIRGNRGVPVKSLQRLRLYSDPDLTSSVVESVEAGTSLYLLLYGESWSSVTTEATSVHRIVGWVETNKLELAP